ncbi:MAG: VOC family protein [Thermoplasmata archaeon]|nr:VOC family protein [Thermoplasmata archaeon]MCI4344615.1 VOC family protein [Thermoplasmata archaeon]
MATKPRLISLMPIRNMNRAIKFYTKVLPGKLEYRGQGPMRDMWAGLRMGTHEVWLIAPEKREKRTLAYNTFLVDNIKGFVRGLQKKGVKFEKGEAMSKDAKIDGPIVFETFGASAFFKDSEGNVLMVWQNVVPM